MNSSTQTATRASKRLKSLISEYGSLNAVSRKYGVNVGMLSAIMHGKKKPPYKLLEALGVVSKRKPEIIRYRWIGRWIAQNGGGFIK